jgi:hypothetical protein
VDDDNSQDPQPIKLQGLAQFREYRMYLTPDYWLITYREADFIRVMRRSSHGNGFCLLCMEVIWELLTGQRTAIRERWALSEALYRADGKELSLKAAAQARRVIEFWFEKRSGKQQPTVKEDSDNA